MIDRTQQRALMAEVEFISERMKLAKLIYEATAADGRFELAGLMVAIEQVWLMRVREIRDAVKREADRLGIELRCIEHEGRTLRYEAWKDGRMLGRSDMQPQRDINDMIERIFSNMGFT